jgi:cell fate (sporulation/competence/biofilm development) regulator YlbF (YheA/YmcA/DUF963 family)
MNAWKNGFKIFFGGTNMANVYDLANDLEKALRDSDEFQELKKMHDEVNQDESAKRIFDNFRDLQLNLQQKQMQGEQPTEEEVQQAQQQLQLIQQHDKISNLMELEQRMSVTINDLNKIMMKPLEDLYGTEE